jgi:uncharacterized protein involved in exopolysaccharide biosynthesis
MELKDYLLILKRRSGIIVGVFAGLALLLYSFNLLKPREYSASAQILFKKVELPYLYHQKCYL